MNYWLMSMKWGNKGPDYSGLCREKGIIAIGYYSKDGQSVGNLSDLDYSEFKRIIGHDRASKSLWSFINEMQAGDVVYVRGKRATTVGRAIVSGNHVFNQNLFTNEEQWKEYQFWDNYRTAEWDAEFPKKIKESLTKKSHYTIEKLEKADVLDFEIRHNLRPLEQIFHAKNNTEEIIESTCDITVKEGAEKYGAYTRYERSPKLRAEAIKIHGYTCKVRGCEFNFKNKYGEDFIEVHHINQLSQTKETDINPATDLITVCSNCHRMIHRKRDKPLTIEELEEMIR